MLIKPVLHFPKGPNHKGMAVVETIQCALKAAHQFCDITKCQSQEEGPERAWIAIHPILVQRSKLTTAS